MTIQLDGINNRSGQPSPGHHGRPNARKESPDSRITVEDQYLSFEPMVEAVFSGVIERLGVSVSLPLATTTSETLHRSFHNLEHLTQILFLRSIHATKRSIRPFGNQ